MKISQFLVFMFLLSVFSCSEGQQENEEEKRPDTISWNLRQTSFDGERKVVSMAGKVEVFNDDEITIFANAIFREYNENNVLLREGSADNIRLFRENEGTASGDIQIRDFTEEAELSASALTWSEEDKILEGEGLVTIEDSGGFSVSGTGFSANLARNTYQFTNSARGVVTTDDE